jgi:acyl-CoA synthetase (AMP-forming)/AMP-acid ligase II
MLDLSQYSSIGAALREAMQTFAGEVCLIEADRERENHRLTYREFAERAAALAKALQDGGFGAGERASIIMTNQSKWLISAYAIFNCGGVLVPLDYKLTAEQQWGLLRHSGAAMLITEYAIWRQLAAAGGGARGVRGFAIGAGDGDAGEGGVGGGVALGGISRGRDAGVCGA